MVDAVLDQRRAKLVGWIKSWIKKFKIRFLIYPLLVAILWFGAFIRTRNLPLLEGKYLIELDSYYFMRIAKHILNHGSLMAWDNMRYVPLGHDPSTENVFLSYVIVYLHKFLIIFFPNLTLEKTDIIYPVIFFVLGLIVFFFLVKALFNEKIALIAAAILAVTPAYLYRSIAGFSDKESLALFLLFVTFYLYVKAWQAKKYDLLFAFAAGITTSLMGLAWGGFKFALLIIALFNIVLFVINKFEKKDAYNYATWLFTLIFILSFLTQKYGGFIEIVKSIYFAIPLMILAFFIGKILLDKIKLKINFPTNLLSIASILIIALILGLLIMPSFVFEQFNEVKEQMVNPMGRSRVMLTVAESKQPYFTDWTDTFGLSYFWIFFFGSIVMFYLLTEPIGKWRKSLTLAYAFFLSGYIFSRISQYSLFNGDNAISQILFFGSLIAFAAIIFYSLIYFYYKNKGAYNSIKELSNNYLFVFAWFVILVITARGGIRLLFVLAPITAVMAAFLVSYLFEKAIKFKDLFYKVVVVCLIILISVPIYFVFAKTSLTQAYYTGSSTDKQWQDAMAWVREKTQKNAVFAHWWDYGYAVQTLGERATVLDGGNYIGYWNHLMARHVLAGKNSTEAFEFMYVHNVTHLLIISDEIGKYAAYSSIGSDSNYDTFSWIGTYMMNSQSTYKEGNLTDYVFQGGTALDEDFSYKEKIFPQKETVIAGFIVPVYETDYEMEIKQPKAIIYYKGERTDVPVECMYDDGKKTFFNESGLKGCLRIFPYYLNQRYQQENGALLYVSRKGLDAMWTRLFLFEEDIPGFELAYDDSDLYNLAIYGGRLMGPLKIWKVNYPKNFTVSEELRELYTVTITPEWMVLDQRSPWNE